MGAISAHRDHGVGEVGSPTPKKGQYQRECFGLFPSSTTAHGSPYVRAVFPFLVGICLGMIMMEKSYLYYYESQEPLYGSQGGLDLQSSALHRKMSAGDGSQMQTMAPMNDLHRLLLKIAPQKEVMIAISNMNLVHSQSLLLWLEGVQQIESTNWLVVAIDEQLRDWCREKGISHYYRPVVIPKTQAGTGDNHAVSAMKYEIIEEFLQLGWNVLLSDVDIVTVQDPFKFLYRDADVEGMSDGWDTMTVRGEIFGFDDPSMGWSRYAQGTKKMAFNSGLFYIRANERTIQLMKNIYTRLRKESAWDQSVFNQEMFYVPYGDDKKAMVTARAMDIHTFMNSKVLFKFVRKMQKDRQPKPVMIHMNYHPDKTERMRAAIKYYLEHDETALDSFPGGSEPGT